MGKRNVFICTRNTNYGEQIVRFIAGKHNPEIHIELLTERTDKRKFQTSDYVVSDDVEWLQNLTCQKICIVRQPEQEENEIFMYQGRERWYQRLLCCVGMEHNEEPKKGGEDVPKVVCVFSPEGGDEKTLLALHYALEKSDTQRVLYVSLCGFPVFFREEISHAPKGAKMGVSELFLCVSKDEFQKRINQLVFPMGSIYMIPPVEHYKDLLDFSAEEVARFMFYLQEQTSYDVVVLEVGQLFEYTLELLQQAERVLVPLEPGFLAEVKRHVFGEYCRLEGKGDILESIDYVPVSFSTPKDRDEMNVIFCGEEECSESGRKKEKRTNPKFGSGANSRRWGA